MHLFIIQTISTLLNLFYLIQFELWREIDLIFWTIANSTTAFCAVYSFQNTKRDILDDTQKKANLYWGVYFLFMLLANSLGVITRLYISELYGTEIAYITERSTLLMLDIGWFALIYYYDSRMKLFKYPIFTYFIIIITILTSVVGYQHGDVFELILTFLNAAAFSLVPIVFLIIARQSVGKIKTSSYLIFFATVLFGLGIVVQKQNVMGFLPELASLDYFVIFAPLLITISNILMYLGVWGLYEFRVE